MAAYTLSVLNGLWSGAAGLVVGAVLGLLLAVLFEDYLKELREGLMGWARRILTKDALPIADRKFQIGDLHTSLVIVEGDGAQVIGEHAVRVIVEPDDVELPAELKRWKSELVEANHRARIAGHHYFWNGLSYAVCGLSIARSGVDEAPQVALRPSWTDSRAPR